MNDTLELSKVQSFVLKLNETQLPLANGQKAAYRSILANNDFPTTRNEKWKYTRLAKIAKLQPQFFPARVANIDAYKIVQNACNLVFVNGYFSRELSSQKLPQGMTMKSIDKMNADEWTSFAFHGEEDAELFTALNGLYLQDGIYLEIEPKAVLEQTVQIIALTTGENLIANPRLIIKAGKFSESEFVFGTFSENATDTITNWSSYFLVEENAKLKFDKIQYEGSTCYQINEEFVKQERSSNFTINTVTLNGAIVRNSLNIQVVGENCETHLNGAYLLKDDQHVDNHTIVDHTVANCESNELYKGVIDDKGTAVFNGKVFVRKDAQKINAFQSNGNVLLSDSATVNSKPELEIYADDVKCSHGSTTGQLDEEAIFYLRARGISEKSARQLMVAAFIEDVLEKIDNEEIIDYIHAILRSRFNWTI